MDPVETSRLEWQRAQADLQKALADLEKLVASVHASADQINKAHAVVRLRRASADDLLQRHITQLGKSG